MTRHELITGMSGTGKSTVIRALAEAGCEAVDLDNGYMVLAEDGTRLWNDMLVGWLLDADKGDVLFVAGCEENMVDFLPRFDSIVLLTAPSSVLLQRVAERANNPFGKAAPERQRIEFDIAQIEPRLRTICDVEINTDGDLELVIHQLLLLT